MAVVNFAFAPLIPPLSQTRSENSISSGLCGLEGTIFLNEMHPVNMNAVRTIRERLNSFFIYFYLLLVNNKTGILYNMKDTDKVTLSVGQLKRLVNESKTKKKIVKESSIVAQDVVDDLVERAQEIVDKGGNIQEAVAEAIDQGLIWHDDIIALLQRYGTISDKTITDSYYEQLFDDVYSNIQEPEEDDEEEITIDDEEEE
jgi:hypothetical protein